MVYDASCLCSAQRKENPSASWLGMAPPVGAVEVHQLVMDRARLLRVCVMISNCAAICAAICTVQDCMLQTAWSSAAAALVIKKAATSVAHAGWRQQAVCVCVSTAAIGQPFDCSHCRGCLRGPSCGSISYTTEVYLGTSCPVHCALAHVMLIACLVLGAACAMHCALPYQRTLHLSSTCIYC